MTYVIDDGPPETDATHAWAPLSGTAPPVLGEQGILGPGCESWIAVIAVDGLRDLPEIVDNRAPRTFGVGEITYPARVLGKTLVYQLQARHQSREGVRGLVSACVRGFGLSMSDEGTMTITPYAAIGGPVWTFSARCIALDADSAPTEKPGLWHPFRLGFTVSLRMSDHKFYTGGSGYA